MTVSVRPNQKGVLVGYDRYEQPVTYVDIRDLSPEQQEDLAAVFRLIAAMLGARA